MEEIGNIKSFRNNLMIVSISIILFFLFSNNITKVNIFGIIELSNIQNIKFLLILFIVNIYVLLRYYSYFIKLHFNLNYVLLFKMLFDRINNGKIKGSINRFGGHGEKSITIDNEGTIIYEYIQKNGLNDEYFWRESEDFTNILSNKNIKGTLLDKKNVQLSLIDNRYQYRIKIDLEKQDYISMFKFYLLENAVFDYYFPLIIGIISHIILVIQLTYIFT